MCWIKDSLGDHRLRPHDRITLLIAVAPGWHPPSFKGKIDDRHYTVEGQLCDLGKLLKSEKITKLCVHQVIPASMTG